MPKKKKINKQLKIKKKKQKKKNPKTEKTHSTNIEIVGDLTSVITDLKIFEFVFF